MNHGRYRAEGSGHVARLAERATAKIRASAGPEADHQAKRPLLGHLDTAAWLAWREAELAALSPQEDAWADEWAWKVAA
jgi:hypothetical protein